MLNQVTRQRGQKPGTHRKERLPSAPSLHSSAMLNPKRSCLDANWVHHVPAESTVLTDVFRTALSTYLLGHKAV
jgi:hypothetical protein